MSELGCTAKGARPIEVHVVNAGYILLGSMAAIVILVCLGATFVVVSSLFGVEIFRSICECDVGTAKAQISNLRSALNSYEFRNDRYPHSLDELSSVGILDGEVPVDPWGNPYLYAVDGSAYLIVSYGADGRPGGSEEDADISSDNLEG